MPAPLRPLAFSLLLAGLLTGCTTYEYDVLQARAPGVTIPPPMTGNEPSNRAGTKDDLIIDIDPIRYYCRSVDNRLVIRAFNRSADTVQLVGVRSAVVDPSGQARPIRSQSIPPGAFVKLILPPVRPEFVSDGGVRIGGGYGYGPGLSRSEFGVGYYDGYEGPARYTLRDAGDVYWDWKSETEAKLILVYTRGATLPSASPATMPSEAGQGEFTHELLFGRRKAK